MLVDSANLGHSSSHSHLVITHDGNGRSHLLIVDCFISGP